MIEINLLPNARKKSRSSSSASSFDFGAFTGNLTSRMKDPWLLVAIAGVVIGLAGVGAQWFFQGRAETALLERERVAVQDSARYAAVVAQRESAEAQRDSISRQIAVITALDGERFIWPHVMDEISRALPTYTWLSSVRQSNPAAAASPEATVESTPTVAIRVIGLTVNVQALTVFMRQLEASPFLQDVTLAVSELTVVDEKEVTEFTLDINYARPDASMIRTVPLSVAVR
jgi:Tfp pilus assembly protein PilN